MDNPEKLATVGTQDTGRRQTQHKKTPKRWANTYLKKNGDAVRKQYIIIRTKFEEWNFSQIDCFMIRMQKQQHKAIQTITTHVIAECFRISYIVMGHLLAGKKEKNIVPIVT